MLNHTSYQCIINLNVYSEVGFLYLYNGELHLQEQKLDKLNSQTETNTNMFTLTMGVNCL